MTKCNLDSNFRALLAKIACEEFSWTQLNFFAVLTEPLALHTGLVDQ